jgi:hypothetical protein
VFRFALMPSALLMGVVLALSAADQGGSAAAPVLLVACVVGAVVVSNLDRGAVLEAGIAASRRFTATLAFSRIAASAATYPELPHWLGATRRCRDQQSRRGAFRRQERPDSPGRQLARAPGQA